jgi:acylphosphatase
MDKMRLHAIVSGRVQGVFFRANTQKVANNIGIRGWVRNMDDGCVEVMAEGKEEHLDDFLKWLHKGSGYARVERVESEYINEEEGFHDFDIVD